MTATTELPTGVSDRGKTPPTRLYELDIARLLAALAVVAFHYTYTGPLLGAVDNTPPKAMAAVTRYGFLGVHFFFMISGFVIFLSRRDRTLKRFAKDRFLRLYPTYWIALAITGSVVVFSAPSRIWEVALDATMLQGLFGRAGIDGAYWSLFHELHFYALVSLAIRFRLVDRLPDVLIGWAIVLVASRVAGGIPLIDTLLILDWAPFFIAGATFSIIQREGRSTWKTRLLIGTSYAVAISQVGARAERQELLWDEPVSQLVLAIVITGLFVLLGVVATRGLVSLRKPKYAILGAMSYPLYVLHQELGLRIIGSMPIHDMAGTALVTICMLAASYLIVTRIEPKATALLRSRIG